MSEGYKVPAQAAEVTLEIKKSQFITRALPVTDKEAVAQALQSARQAYPDARHHCWAYVLGDPFSPAGVACSDDGEPSGTAGKPMLNVLQHKQLGDILLVTIRYFGGVKLGAGGLVRAYSQSAQLALDHCPCREVIPLFQGTVTADFSAEQPLRHWLAQHQGKLQAVDYGDLCRYAIVLPQTHSADALAFFRAQGWDFRAHSPVA